MMTSMTEQLRAFIQQRGSQSKVAREMGISREHLCRVLRGRVALSEKFIGRFAQTYGFDAAAAVFNGRHPPYVNS